MSYGQGRAKLLAAGTATAFALTACVGHPHHTAGKPKVPVALKDGGTLNLLMASDFEHLDPARNFAFESINFGRLLYRTLTTYKSAPGKAGTEVVGDLATDTGTPTDGGQTWRFTLKDGLKYEDGTPITPQDIKYGVERAFDPGLFGGAQYLQLFLANVPAGYAGPKKSHSELSSIVVAGKSITFKLNRPVGDFSYAVAEPTTVPVPLRRDNPNYDARPFSSGPYKIISYEPGKTLTLDRNTFWDKQTDSVRGAHPDHIVCSFGLDQTTIDQRLIADSGQDRTAIDLDTSLAAESIPQAESRQQVRARSINDLNGQLRFVAINTKRVPNLKVRQAINYAVNKESYRISRGGKLAGQYASTILTPKLPGYRKYDLYKSPPQGDQEKAKQLLQQAGIQLPLKMTVASPSVGKGVTQAVSLQAALKRAGIDVTLQLIPPDVYYTTIDNPAKMPDLAFANWAPDWPSGSTVLPPQFDGRQIKPGHTHNLSQFNVPAVNAAMDRINAIMDLQKQAPEWGKLDEQIMQLAPIVPLIYDAGIQLHGSKVKGAYLHAYYGTWDLASISTA